MIDLTTAISGLRAAQAGLLTTSQNINNVNTEGYSRQLVDFRNRAPVNMYGVLIGAGVEVSRIRRMSNETVQSSIIANQGTISGIDVRLGTARQFELLLAPQSGGIESHLSDLHEAIAHLNEHTQDATAQRTVIDKAKQLAGGVSAAANQLQRTRESLIGSLQQAVKDLNAITSELTRLDTEIRTALAKQLEPNDLFDQRDALLGKLGELVDTEVQYATTRNDVPPLSLPAVMLGNGEFRLSVDAPEFSLQADVEGQLSVFVDRRPMNVNVLEGRIGGLLHLYNSLIPDQIKQLDTLAQNIMQTLDSIHATAVPEEAGFQQLFGARGLKSSSLPLSQAAQDGFGLKSGKLYVGITDRSTLNRTVHEVDIDVTTDTLQTIAAKLASISELQATVETEQNTLVVTANHGFGFDFTGVPDTTLTTGWTGTSVLKASGSYTAPSNRDITFKVVGSGNVGATPGLKVEVLDQQTGQLLKTLAVDTSYSPNAQLEVQPGVFVQFASGTLVDGETFNYTLVGQPDETGILSAVGLNSLFTGVKAADMAVSQTLLNSPASLSTSSTGELGDILPLARLLAALDPERPGSLLEQSATLTGSVAAQVAELNSMAENAKFVDETLQAERDSVSGVNTDEELVRMLEFQRAFQAASRLILTSDDMFQDLLSMLR